MCRDLLIVGSECNSHVMDLIVTGHLEAGKEYDKSAVWTHRILNIRPDIAVSNTEKILCTPVPSYRDSKISVSGNNIQRYYSGVVTSRHRG